HRPAPPRRRARHAGDRPLRPDQSGAQRPVWATRQRRRDFLDDQVDGWNRSGRRDAQDRSGAAVKRLVLALLCLAATARAAEPVDPLFVNGETLDYSLTWLKLSGGNARFTIGLAAGASDRFRITSIAQTSSGFA